MILIFHEIYGIMNETKHTTCDNALIDERDNTYEI